MTNILQVLQILLAVVGGIQSGSLFLKRTRDASGLLQCSGSTSCEVVTINETAAAADIISILGCNETLTRNESRVDRVVDGDYTYAPFDGSDCTAFFTYKQSDNRTEIDGQVERLQGGTVYMVEPCFSECVGCHVWKTIQTEPTTKMDDTPDFDESVRPLDRNAAPSDRASRIAELLQRGKDDNTTIVTFSFKAYYTNQFAMVTEDIDLYFKSVIEFTNEGYKNSKIPIRIELACTEHLDFNDDEGPWKFTSMATRDLVTGGADAAGIWVHDWRPIKVCGLGHFGGERGVEFFSMQAKTCAMETLGHEIGHNFGLGHGDAMDTGLGWTIMSFFKGSHMNYFSNLNTQYKGKPMGDMTSNSAKAITERRFMMADHSHVDKCITRSKIVYRPNVATDLSVLPRGFKILASGSCAGSARGPLAVTLLSETGANCTFTAPAASSPGETAAVADLGECALTDFTNGINRMEFQAGGTSWCYDNFELELENGARYKCSSLEYTADLWNQATGNACSAVVIA